MKKNMWSRELILIVMIFFIISSLSPALVISKNVKADPYQDDINFEPLIFVEQGPIQENTLYADGSIIELQTEAVSQPMIGSNPIGLTQNDFKTMILSSRESFESDNNLLIISEGDSRSGLDIVFYVSSPPPGAVAALDAVAAYIESLFDDPITVNINVNFQPMDPGILGGTSCYYAGAPS